MLYRYPVESFLERNSEMLSVNLTVSNATTVGEDLVSPTKLLTQLSSSNGVRLGSKLLFFKKANEWKLKNKGHLPQEIKINKSRRKNKKKFNSWRKIRHFLQKALFKILKLRFPGILFE